MNFFLARSLFLILNLLGGILSPSLAFAGEHFTDRNPYAAPSACGTAFLEMKASTIIRQIEKLPDHLITELASHPEAILPSHPGFPAVRFVDVSKLSPAVSEELIPLSEVYPIKSEFNPLSFILKSAVYGSSFVVVTNSFLAFLNIAGGFGFDYERELQNLANTSLGGPFIGIIVATLDVLLSKLIVLCKLEVLKNGSDDALILFRDQKEYDLAIQVFNKFGGTR